MADESTESHGSPDPQRTALPQTEAELEKLTDERPEGWEFFLFGGVLAGGLEGLRFRERDHQLRLPTAEYHRVPDEEVASYLGEAFGRLGWIIEPCERVFGASEEAFGKPGEAGDPVLIQHFGAWVIGVYAQLMDWAGMVRSAGVSEEFTEAFDLASRAVDRPIDQVRDFIRRMIGQIEELPRLLEGPEPRSPITFEWKLTLSLDNELLGRALSALRVALGQE
jgi:hypothetical protein